MEEQGPALVSGLAWFAFAIANMSGALADRADPEIIGSVLRDTGFGVVWTIRMMIAVALVAITLMRSPATVERDLTTPLLGAGLLASLAGAGHSQIEESWQGLVHVSADAAHLLAAGASLGGLVPLGFGLMVRAEADTGLDAADVLTRFSGTGYAAVATLVGTGLVNSWLLVGSVSGLLHSTYGQMLMAKLAFFAGMLMLAAANRFWLVPALQASGKGDADGSDGWRSKLRTHVLSEQGLGLLVLLSVSILGTIRPAIGQ